MRKRTILRNVQRRLAAGLAVASMAAAFLVPAGLSGVAAAADPPPAHEIKDPHYGDSLFYFFLGRYFTSVTKLMVSQHFGRVAQHADEAEILRGGLFLSYGLHREAGEIFAQLIEKGAAPAVRDRAWFYLAKIRYQRGYLAEAEDAIGRIETHLPPELEEERVLLKANLLMARADYAAAAEVLNGIRTKTGVGQYVRYNLGVALIKSGDIEGGSAVLDELGRAPVTKETMSEEYLSLRDKANVALGFAALQDKHPEIARATLERVRLSGMLANKALLGFGWAATVLKTPQQALVPWTELAQRDPGDAAALEARIALPYAYDELGAYGQSLDLYNEAISAFERENTSLDESIAAIRAGKLLDGLLERNPGEEMGWFWNIGQLPEMPHAAHLAQVLARHEFQEAFKNYRDLQFLAKNLQEWESNLGIFGDMLATRRLGYAERLPQVRAKASGLGLDGLQQRRDDLANELARAEAEADGVPFADARQREQLARLDRVRATLDRIGADPELAAARERHRLAAGALIWDLAQAYPERVWEAKKSFKTIDSELSEARRRDAALAQAQREEPARFDRFAARIAELGQRVRALSPRVAALGAEQQQYVQELAVAELEHQKERLAVYAMQARFAVAQIYDRATQAKDGAHASKP